MCDSICGANCKDCPMQSACSGCACTQGHPFGGECIAAKIILFQGKEAYEQYKTNLMQEFNDLNIPDLPPVTQLAELPGSFVNMAYPLPNGTTVKLLDDCNIYLGSQLPKGDSGRCFGLCADEQYILICEYGENGSDPQIVAYCRRKTGVYNDR